MPFDGVVTKSIVFELNQNILGGRIEKVFQPESDEILLLIRSNSRNNRLLLSANAAFPRIHLTEVQKENPLTAPMFCMFLRKHIAGGKITRILFHDYERMVTLFIDSTDELGDQVSKKLIIEIMGKHSNIILLNQDDKIMDAMFHVDHEISRVREIMPARLYCPPPSQDKQNPEEVIISDFIAVSQAQTQSLNKLLLNHFRGFCPILISKIIERAGLNENPSANLLSDTEWEKLDSILTTLIQSLKNNLYTPYVEYPQPKEAPTDFHCLHLVENTGDKTFLSISAAMEQFAMEKDHSQRLRQKKQELYKNLSNQLERCNKKREIHCETLNENTLRDQYKLYGELILANIYQLPKEASVVKLQNYYSEQMDFVEITLDKTLSPQDNAQKYFKKYSKSKSAYTFAIKQLEDVNAEITYLESVLVLLDHAQNLLEIDDIRQELSEEGYLSIKKSKSRKKIKPSAPLYYKSSDGFDILVGKNNHQNDLLTLKTAQSNDLWFHTKDIPGSHVIIRKSQNTISETAILEAATLAAYHSKARLSSHVPVDYTLVRYVKKPSGAKPGMVIYENQKTLIVDPDETKIQSLSK